MPSTIIPASTCVDAADEPITVVCIDRYCADRDDRDPYAFVFHVPASRTHFTVYATSGDRYTISTDYHLTLTPAAWDHPTTVATHTATPTQDRP